MCSDFARDVNDTDVTGRHNARFLPRNIVMSVRCNQSVRLEPGK